MNVQSFPIILLRVSSWVFAEENKTREESESEQRNWFTMGKANKVVSLTRKWFGTMKTMGGDI